MRDAVPGTEPDPQPGPDPAPRPRPRPGRRHVLLGVLVVADLLVALALLGARAVTAQASRVLDQDTLTACTQALADAQGGLWFDYTLRDARFADRDVLEATWTLAPPPSPDGGRGDRATRTPRPTGTVRCTVAAGEEIDDAMRVTAVSVS